MEPFKNLPAWLKLLLVTMLALALIYGSLYLAEYFMPILILLGATVIITYLLLSPVDWLHERLAKLPVFRSPKIPLNARGISILTIYLLFFLLIAITLTKSIPPLVSQVKSFGEDLPVYTRKLEASLLRFKPINQWYLKMQAHQASGLSTQRLLPSVIPSSISASWAEGIRNKGMQYVVGVGSTTLTTLIYTLTMFVLVFYLLMDGHGLKRSAVLFLPNRLQGRTAHYLSDIHQVLNAYIKSQLILAFLVGIYLYVIYSMLGIEYAFFLSVFYAITSIVPVLGPWFGTIPTLLVVLFSEQPVVIIPILISLSVFYAVKVYWLIPKLFKIRLNIHPVVMILTLLACMKLGHLPGLLLAFPLASLICGTQQYLIERQAAKEQFC